VKGGLSDLSVSRTSFSWGVPVPDDPAHVMYVWFDALTNYLSALGDGPLREGFWPPDVHLVGKDILRFHAVFWPAFLMAAGYPDDQLPRQIFAHGWLTINGQKMSKTLRNVVEPLALARAFGADVVRYHLLREIAFGQDGDFSHRQLVGRYNAELADGLGNLLNRTLGLVTKLRPAGVVLSPTARGPLEERLEQAAVAAHAEATAALGGIAPHKALEAVYGLVRAGNKYVDEAAPWAEAKKGDDARVDTILATTLEVLRWLTVLLWPVMPDASARLRAQLALPALAPVEGVDALALTFVAERSTTGLVAGQPVFPKIDADAEARIFTALGLDPEAAPPPEAKPKKGPTPKRAPIEPAKELSFEEYARLDLRVGTVLEAERVPKSDKLLRVQVDLGEGAPRQVVAGIGKAFAPEALVGKQVVVVANLAPAKLLGHESRGMILAVRGEGDHDLALLTTSTGRAPGARIS
jgi:methionyl-tRNA synthetase